MKLFRLATWSGLEKTVEQKSNIFLSQFALIAMLAGVISFFHDLFFESWSTVLIDVIIVIIFASCYWINEVGKHLFSKLIFVIVGPAIIFFYAIIIPKESAIYFFFFPIITITFLLFDREDQAYKIAAIIYALSLLVILEMTDYRPFDLAMAEQTSSETSYIVNITVSIVTVILTLITFDNLNESFEQNRNEAIMMVETKNEELKEINAELDRFVYSASHDLKSPLLSVLGLVNVAKYEVKDETALDYFNKIETRVNKLNTFIKEVIEISRNTRTEVLEERFNLKELVAGVFENNNYLEDVNSLKVDMQISKSLKITADKSRLEIILNNLISNAIKYRNQSKDDHEISISAKTENNKLAIIISDEGIGISEEAQVRMFEMFYRGHDGSEGSGLGLYIVKSTLEKIGGAITVDSTLGEGTTIALTIPIR